MSRGFTDFDDLSRQRDTSPSSPPEVWAEVTCDDCGWQVDADSDIDAACPICGGEGSLVRRWKRG